MKVRQTTCRHCGLDIENFFPYHIGEWRDRGNNTQCPILDQPFNAPARVHAPVIERRQIVTPRRKSMKIKRKPVVVGRNDGTGRRRRFATLWEAEVYVGALKDQAAVLAGKYYIDAPDRMVNPRRNR